MKNQTYFTILGCIAAAVVIALPTSLLAQQPKPDAPPVDPKPRPHPIIAAFDTDKDGVISSEEIEYAVTSLKALDKNGDGKLTPDELMPRRRNERKEEGKKGGK